MSALKTEEDTSMPLKEEEKVSLSLDELCGYYSWVVDDSSYDDRYDTHNDDDEECNAYGGLTLKTSQTPATLESMTGTIKYNESELNFAGLVVAENPVGLTMWNLKTKDCDSESENTFDDEKTPVTITVMNTRDDRGYPFIRVEWAYAWTCSFYVIGKRQRKGFKSLRSRKGKILDLTEGEMKRLGICEEGEQ